VRFAVWLPAVLCLLVAAGLGAWILSGGHVLVVQTPSMGTAAPVGSLVLTHSVADAQLHRGMIIAFRVPSTHAVYLHRIAQILPGGRIRTRGDLNGADDGWVLTRSAIVGLPALIMPGIGWLLLAAPWALGALMLGGFLAIILPRALRPSIRAITIGAAVSLPLYLLRPFSRVAVVDTVRTSHGFVARLVNAGLFPLRVTLRSSSIVLAPAHAGNITAQLAGHSTSLLAATVLIPLWGWMLFAAFVLAPLAVSTFALKTEPPLPASVRRPGKLRKRLVAWLEGRPHQPLAGVGSP
jgi:hypothetical protein